jgi:hypothetical protein
MIATVKYINLTMNCTMNTLVDPFAAGMAGGANDHGLKVQQTVDFPFDDEFDEFDFMEAFDILAGEENADSESAIDFSAGQVAVDLRLPSPVQEEDIVVAKVKDVAPAAEMTFREAAIARWKVKRSRRSFRKKVVCKARGDVAKERPRVGGRFVKSHSTGWVAITSL